MVHIQYECQDTHYKQKTIYQKGANQRIKNQGKSLEGQWSLELLKIPIELGQAWMGRPEEMRPPEESILFFDSQVLQ